jgi:hypothetical protein
MKNLLLMTPVALLAACASPTLPSNAILTPGSTQYIDRIEFPSPRSATATFSKVKLCLAQNVQNDQATLRDSAGSFVGAYTRNYYQSNNVQTVGGGSVFKYVDDAAGTAILNGMTVVPPSGAILSADYVRFEVKAVAAPSSVNLTFYAITRAQQNTGSMSNSGFAPVGVWTGSRAEGVYNAVEQVATTVKTCIAA